MGEITGAGAFTLIALGLCSLAVWAVIFERLWRYRRLGNGLRAFQLEASNALLRGEASTLLTLCQKNQDLPTAQLLQVALERMAARDARMRERWLEAVERRRQLINQELRQNLWVLGTIASAAPFIGLFGTVVGILQSFREMAQKGSGGFTVVAAGISEALIATAAGIIVAVIAVMAFNAFQTRWSSLVLQIKIEAEELVDLLSGHSSPGGATHGP